MDNFIDFKILNDLFNNTAMRKTEEKKSESVEQNHLTSESIQEEKEKSEFVEQYHSVPGPKQTVWSRFASKAKSVWKRVRPIISGLTTFFTTTTALFKSISGVMKQYKNMREAFV